MTKNSLYNSTIWVEFGIKKQLTATFFRNLNLNVSINLRPADKILINHPDYTEDIYIISK